MTSCSTGPASRPYGAGQCGKRSPRSPSSRRWSSGPAAATSATTGSSSIRSGPATSSGSSTPSDRRAPPTACRATEMRRAPAPPSSWRVVAARRRWRWASCSHVNPIPPSTWMASFAARTPPSRASAPAAAAERCAWAGSSPSAASAASQTAPVICSTAVSRFASRCLTPWNCPIGRPNWMRVRACSVAVSRDQRALPTSSADATTTATSSTSADVTPSSTRSGATVTPSSWISAVRRVGSRHGRPTTVTPAAGWPSGPRSSIAHHRTGPATNDSASGDPASGAPATATGTTATAARPAPRTAGSVPVTDRTPPAPMWAAGSGAGDRPKATHAGGDPSSTPGRSDFCTSPLPRASNAAARAVGTNGPGAITRPSSSATIASSRMPNP